MLPRGLLFGFLVSLTLPLLLSAWGWGPTVLPVSLAPGAHRPVRGCPHRPPETPGSAGRASRPGLLGGLLPPGEGREVGFSPGLCACAPCAVCAGAPRSRRVPRLSPGHPHPAPEGTRSPRQHGQQRHPPVLHHGESSVRVRGVPPALCVPPVARFASFRVDAVQPGVLCRGLHLR